jgi:glycosyltransferase involved in cell wall biosynthesis
VNILFLSQVLPYPLDAGPKVRMYYMLRYLAQRHDVTLVSFARGEKAEYVKHLRSFCRAVHTVTIRRSPARDAFFLLRSLLKNQPFLIERDHVPQMHTMIKDLLDNNHFDAIHADQLWMAQYVAPGLLIKKVLDQHNAVWTIVYRLWQNSHLGPYRLLMALEWRKLQRYEAKVCGQFDHVVTVTEEDKRALQSLDSSNKLNLSVIPICIDPDTVPRVKQNVNAKNIVCIGGMFYPPNVDGVLWFARQVFPLVRHEIPESHFWIVGARPDRRIVQLGREDASVQVTGYIEDTNVYLCDSAVFIVPLRAGGGMRVKILDAWARGIPIVSTTIGCEGIDVQPGVNILIADTPADFAQAVLRVIRDPALGKRLAENGRRWVETHYDWRQVYRGLDQVYPVS